MPMYYVNRNAVARHERHRTGISARQQRLRRSCTLNRNRVVVKRWRKFVESCAYFNLDPKHKPLNRSDRRKLANMIDALNEENSAVYH